jgi:hypothetical protein
VVLENQVVEAEGDEKGSFDFLKGEVVEDLDEDFVDEGF